MCFAGSKQIGGDIGIFESHAFIILIPDNFFHLNEVNDAFEVFFSTNRQLQRNRLRIQTVFHLFDNAQEVRPGAIHFVDVSDAWNAVLVRLTPNGFSLRLYAADRAEHQTSAIKHPQ